MYVVSNFHKPQDQTVSRNRTKEEIKNGKEPGKKEIDIPKAVSDYNKYMRGVDIFDQNCSYYIPRLRSRKWYIRVFFHLLEIAINNSFVLYESFLK